MPLQNKKYTTNKYNKKSFLGYEFQRDTQGNMLFYGRKPESQRGPGAGERIKNLFTRDNIANKYATIDDLNKGSGKGLFNRKSSPVENVTPLDQGSNIFQTDATALQSDAKSRQIYGGTAEQRREAMALADDIPVDSELGGGSESGGEGGAAVAGVAALGGAVLDELDTDNKYGGMDVGKEALKYAGMGASLGSVIPGVGTAVGAAAGALIGGTVGMIKKGKFERQERRADRKESRKRRRDEKKGLISSEAEEFFEASGAATQAYGAKHIDSMINKYAQ